MNKSTVTREFEVGDQGNHDLPYIGMRISVFVHDDANDKLHLGFEGGYAITVYDSGQSCCENRYMTIDDDLQDLVGGVLGAIYVSKSEIKDPEQPYGDHEVAFLRIVTDKGEVCISTHNEHNGYYGGFGLKIIEIARPAAEFEQPNF